MLRDGERRRRFDHRQGPRAGEPSGPQARAEGPATPPCRGAVRDQDLVRWLKLVHAPIDRLLAQVINPFPAQLRDLAADPYDDELMAVFCAYLEQSRLKLDKVDKLYRSQAAPAAARDLALGLYHCLSQVQDALADLERYTMGYVDSYLRDGRELLRQAKRQRSQLLEQRRCLDI